MNASVYSVYMDNIHPDVVSMQKDCVERLLPDGWKFQQVLHKPAPEELFHHATALTSCLGSNPNPITIFLDIDCIPLTPLSLGILCEQAEQGYLIGAAQRANHLSNEKHIYVGPFCMAFLNAQYKKLGSPSFNETARGDCAEELTYCWEAAGQEVKLLWPTDISRPMWDLKDSLVFGYGTTYEGFFYHSFGIREAHMQSSFLAKCKEVLKSNGPKKEIQASQEIKPRETQPRETQKEVRKESRKSREDHATI